MQIGSQTLCLATDYTNVKIEHEYSIFKINNNTLSSYPTNVDNFYL